MKFCLSDALQALGRQPRHHVGDAAGREGRDDRDGALRPGGVSAAGRQHARDQKASCDCAQHDRAPHDRTRRWGTHRVMHAPCQPFCGALSHTRREPQSSLALLQSTNGDARVTIADRRVDLPWPCHHRSACAERLPQPPSQDHRAGHPRRRLGYLCAADRAAPVGGVRPAVRHRQPARRRHPDRHGGGDQCRRRWLHALSRAEHDHAAVSDEEEPAGNGRQFRPDQSCRRRAATARHPSLDASAATWRSLSRSPRRARQADLRLSRHGNRAADGDAAFQQQHRAPKCCTCRTGAWRAC